MGEVIEPNSINTVAGLRRLTSVFVGPYHLVTCSNTKEIDMLFQKFVDAWENKNAEAEAALFHDEWEFKFHSTGKVLKKQEMTLEDRRHLMDTVKQTDRRCIYENDDILVMHSISHFPNGTADAVMMIHLKKDGLLWRTETGSTPINK